MKNQSISTLIILLLFGYNLTAQNSDNNYPATSEEITIRIGNDSIAAFGMFAAGKEKKETVILLHGLPGNERNLDLAQELRRNGRNVIYFNYRGAWGSQGEFLYSNCLEDIKQVMDFFSTSENSEKFRIESKSFILFGHSMGGGIALISGAKDSRVHKIAVYSPWNVGYGPKDNDAQIEEFKKMLNSYFMLNIDSQNFIEDLIQNKDEYDILSHKKQLANKQLLIIDENERNKVWIEELDNTEYILIKTDHSFSDKRLELIEKVCKWINN
jgi:pimeloyl-ACP methyl ester carboxylesterase